MTRPCILASFCFIVSGAASISYQLLWLRYAMSHFGVVTPVISVLLSVFMLGLALGSLAGGRIAAGLSGRKALAVYAAVEFAIAVLAGAVPVWFEAGYAVLLGVESLESVPYLLGSALIIAVALLPPCLLTGMTLPLMMRVLQQEQRRSFGLLYASNLTGALLGCGLPLALIEWLGLSATLHVTAFANAAAGGLALAFLCFTRRRPAAMPQVEPEPQKEGSIPAAARDFLFLTGFATLGSELLWVKAYTPALGSSVYAFAMMLGTYLTAGIAGNICYLRNAGAQGSALRLLPFASLLVLFATDAAFSHLVWPLIPGIAPLSFLLGYLTPQVIDTAAAGSPRLAARACAWNFAGCIMGPLVTGYALFPLLGLKASFLFHAALMSAAAWRMRPLPDPCAGRRALGFLAMAGLALCTRSNEESLAGKGILYRDHTGYVAATETGAMRRLSVNGVPMTSVTTITKQMMHLPAALHGEAKSALIICMGMGTTLRSAAAWPLDAITVVELSPAVVKTFPYFHDDAPAILTDPRLRLVLDDGRRYLLRRRERYDIITIDPPPPLDASASGLLYSADFMAVLTSRLTRGGILAHWVPKTANHPVTRHVIAAIAAHFPHIRLYEGLGGWGTHILASASPLPPLSPEAYIQRLPGMALQDLMEYHKGDRMENLAVSLLRERPVPVPLPPPLTDDRLYNEFNRLRRYKLLKY